MATAFRALIVDDNLAAATSLALVLKSLGHTPHTTSNGRAALEILRGFHPHVAFIDVEMPGMDGHEVARRVRAVSEYASLPIIAFTAFDAEAVRRHVPRCDFDHHLPKPFRMEEVKVILQIVAERCAPPIDGPTSR